MRNKLKRFVAKYGKNLCALAVFITSYGVLSCRGIFYQPKEPENLYKIIK